MDQIKLALKAALERYNKTLPHHDHTKHTIFTAHTKLALATNYRRYGLYKGTPEVPYSVFDVDGILSRPVREEIYIREPRCLVSAFEEFSNVITISPSKWTDSELTLANQIVYTSVMAVACCYDLWQRGSRKTPGTFFEVFMASILQQMLPTASFSKHIPLMELLGEPGDDQIDLEAVPETENEGPGSVSTDLVVKRSLGANTGLVIPLKITTRERIVQPFADQRILDSAFGQGAYRSMLVCISETQLDDKSQSVKQVCVPGTVKLFQKYLAPLSGLYYCDVPQRYAAPDMQRIIPVRSVGHFFQDFTVFLER